MPINTKTEFNYSQWQELTTLKAAEGGELENIKCHLNLVLLALEAIANINSEKIIQAAQDLHLESAIGDRLTLWRKTTGEKLDIEQVRSLVLIICYLANQHQELLRRGVSLLEQAENESPHHTALLGNYLDRFIDFYQARMINSQHIAPEFLSHLAWKLLSDLLFYSSQNGHCLLWVAVLDAAQIN